MLPYVKVLKWNKEELPSLDVEHLLNEKHILMETLFNEAVIQGFRTLESIKIAKSPKDLLKSELAVIDKIHTEVINKCKNLV